MEEPEYELELKSRTDRGKEIYKFASADGVASKNSFRDSELLLADTAEPEIDDRILVAQSGYGFLPVILADQAPEGFTVAAETSDRAFQLTQKNLKKNGVENASAQKVSFYNEINEVFDRIVYAPRGYEPVKLVKNRLSNLIGILSEGGQLFVAGQKTDGINRYKDYLDSLSGKMEKIDQDGSQKIYCYTKSGDPVPESFDIETSFEAELLGEKLSFKACEGLFSPHKIDDGTRLLIENIEVEQGDEVLDLACGYGAIGIFLKKINDVELSLSDDNKIATKYAEKNLKANSIEKYNLKNKDCLDGFKDQKFDVMVANPPTHQGSSVTEEMFKQSHQALKEDGKLYLVYNPNMKFEDDLTEIFEDTEILVDEEYRVLKAVK